MTSTIVPLSDGANVGPAVMAVGWTLLPISCIIVGLRFLAKLRGIGPRWDDYMILIALLIQIAYNVTFTEGAHWGLGRHMSDLDPVAREHTLKWILLSEPLAVLSSMFGRIGFAIYVINIVGLTEPTYRNILRAVIAAQFIANVAVVAQLLSQCGPHVAALWNPAIAAVTICQSPMVETYFGYTQSSINSVCDLALTVIPILVVKQLHLSTRTKLGLLGLLCLSLFAFVASLIKAISIKNLAVRNNFSYNMAYLVICCTVENNLVVIGASIPTLKPLLRALTGQSSSAGGKYYDNQNPSAKETGGATRASTVLRTGKRDDGITCKTDIVVHEEDFKEDV